MLTLLKDFLAPPHCAFCRRPINTHLGACDACIQDLPWRQSSRVEGPDLTIDVVAPLDYTFPIDAAIRAWKYRRREYYVPVFTALMSELAMQLDDGIDLIMPVPLHWRRLATRGFNQAEILARSLSKTLDVPCSRAARRVNHTPAQSKLTATERRRNLRSAFVMKSALKHAHVLLVDDVVTTGGTLSCLANAVQEAGVEKVSAVTLAQTPRR